MRLKAHDPELTLRLDGTMLLTVSIDPVSKEDAQNAALELAGKKLSLDIKAWREKRSLDANAYLWTLCGKLAAKLGGTSEEVYREMIVGYGVSDVFTVIDLAVPTLERQLRANGHLGSFIRVRDSARGYSTVAAFVGSSDYDTAEMARLIDGTIEECKLQGIDTLTPNEKARMMSLWEAKHGA